MSSEPAGAGDVAAPVPEAPVPEAQWAELRAACEAIMLVVDEPVSEAALAEVLDRPAEQVGQVLAELSAEYTAAGRGFDLRQAAGGWRLYTRGELAPYVERFEVTVLGQRGDSPDLVDLRAEVSFDSGQTWSEAVSVPDGDGRYAVTVNHPVEAADSAVSVRVTAVDSQGAKVVQTQPDLYGIGEVSDRPSGTLNGTVTDADTDAPIVDATVTASMDENSYSTVTDLSGGYELRLGPGSWEVEVDAEGYGSVSDQVELSGDGTVTWDTALEANGQSDPELSQRIVATLAEEDGSLVVSVDPQDREVLLPTFELSAEGDRWETAGDLRPVTVTDTRADRPGWDVSGQVSAFETGDGQSFDGSYLGWVPEILEQGETQGVSPGGQVSSGFFDGDGLATSRTLGSAPAGEGAGTAQLGAQLQLVVPTDTEYGQYEAVLTFSVM